MLKDEHNGVVLEEKCVRNENIWICVMFNYLDGSMLINYSIVNGINNEKIFGLNGNIETTQWVISDINSKEFQCNDHFIDYEKICVGKQSVLVKDKNANKSELKLSLLDKSDWNEIYQINDVHKRLCRDIWRNRICVELQLNDESNHIKQINKILIQKVLRN